jgi:hypothetical protein
MVSTAPVIRVYWQPSEKFFSEKKCGGPVRKFLKGTLYIKHPVRNYGEA